MGNGRLTNERDDTLEWITRPLHGGKERKAWKTGNGVEFDEIGNYIFSK